MHVVKKERNWEAAFITSAAVAVVAAIIIALLRQDADTSSVSMGSHIGTVYGPGIDDEEYWPGEEPLEKANICREQCLLSGIKDEESQEFWKCVDRCMAGN